MFVCVITPRVIRAMRQLESSYNPDARKILEEANEVTQEEQVETEPEKQDDLEAGRGKAAAAICGYGEFDLVSLLTEICLISSNLDGSMDNILEPTAEEKAKFVEPKILFEKAWNHPDP